MSGESVIDFFDEEDSFGDSSVAENLGMDKKYSSLSDEDDSDEDDFEMPSLEELGVENGIQPHREPLDLVDSYDDEDYSVDEDFSNIDSFEEEDIYLPGDTGMDDFADNDFSNIDNSDDNEYSSGDEVLDSGNAHIDENNRSSNFKNLQDDDFDDDEEVEHDSGDSIDDILAAASIEEDEEESHEFEHYVPSVLSSGAYDTDDEEEMSRIRRFNIDAAFSNAIDSKASDVHINADDNVYYTIDGDVEIQNRFGVIDDRQAHMAFEAVTNHKRRDDYVVNFELDTSYVLRQGAHVGRRFRVNVAKSFGQVSITARVISDTIPTPQELDMDKRIANWANLPNGLVLVCGPTGSGKSTTFASIVNEINYKKKKKIVTVEKPIEYVYPKDGKALIVQREVGGDTRSFAAALKSAMRQAPNIILVGEVRDREEFDELLKASESGHLALSTMHTNSPPATINRIKSLYAGDEQTRILNTLKDNMRGLVNQVLARRADGKGRVGIQTVLEITPEVSEMIGRGDSGAMEEHMRKTKSTLEHVIGNYVLNGTITYEEALEHTVFPSYLDEVLIDSGFTIPE